MKTILSILLSYIMATAVSHASVPLFPASLLEDQAPEVVKADSGKCGGNVMWKYHEKTKVLEIYGKGPMWTYGGWFDAFNYIKGGVPWIGKPFKTLIIRKGVKSITQGVFKSSAELTSVIIPGTVKRIDKNAFEDCSKLTYVVMSDGVKEIGERAFANCPNIWSIAIPNSVKVMESYAFFRCKMLRTVNLSNSLKSISPSAFSYCENLDSVDIPEGVKSIEPLAFYKCGNLTTITLPKSLKSIGEGALGRTRILYGSLEHPVAIKDKCAFVDHPNPYIFDIYDETNFMLDNFDELVKLKRRAEERVKK